MRVTSRNPVHATSAAVLWLAMLLCPTSRADQDSQRPRPAPDGEILSWPGPDGEILPRPGPGEEFRPFLLESTRVETTITGPVAHVEVTQTWKNSNADPVDGLYIFPLPENAAVTDMSLQIGRRRIHGEMRRREEAQAIYEQARREGRVAGLLDQERSNVFAQMVANLLPGARIEVILAFDHEIRCEEGACEYVFPTVVGPRFIPARQTHPGRIDPPVIGPGGSTGQRLEMNVDLDAGVGIHALGSPSHAVRIIRRGGGRARVTLDSSDGGRLDRDFRLRWRTGGEQSEVGVLAWRDLAGEDEPGVFTLIIQPPGEVDDAQATPRELVFLLDCSGSMSGMPLEASKNVVRRALRAVRPEDSFQIQRFSNTTSGLGPAPVAATPVNVARGLAYLDTLRGEGGTEMLAGVRAALDLPEDPERLRIVMLLTDGFIGNEREVLAAVRQRLGSSRLFSFGIGSSVNRALLESIAEEGRGAAAFLGLNETPDQMVDRFVARIATPVLTDIRIAWQGLQVDDLEPARTPDLFAGQPLVIHGRYRAPGSGRVRVGGLQNGRPVGFSREVTLPSEAADHEALGRLWARARIHRLEREQHHGERSDVREAVIALGLRHRLMTSGTSLVAVDSGISNTTGSSVPVSVPVEMPEGVSHQGVFGQVAARSAASGAPSAASQLPPQSPDTKMAAEQSLALPLLGRNQSDTLRPAPGMTATDKDAGAAGYAASQPHFERLTLVRGDGMRIVVEADGEVWRVAAAERMLVHSLTAAEMEALRVAIHQTRPDTWIAATGGARLVLESGGMRRVTPAHPGAGPLGALVRMLEDWAR